MCKKILNYKFDIQCSVLITVLFLELEVRGRREILLGVAGCRILLLPPPPGLQ
jgi:hypothetical protein